MPERVPAYHIGRSWFGNEIEAECPCPKEPCGLVDPDKAHPDCAHHPLWRSKSMRQGHPAKRCPGSPQPTRPHGGITQQEKPE